MLDELDTLRIVGERLKAANVPFMLTGSFAMAYYGKPRMTRDLDLVVALAEEDIDAVVSRLSPDFYVDADDVRAAVNSQRLFNLMHHATGIKIDLIVRKNAEYRLVEFARRRAVELSGVQTWIVSREDLILSKLVWARESASELQRRDVKSLIDDSIDWSYFEHWAQRLGVLQSFKEISA
jgi:hypothetical protein